MERSYQRKFITLTQRREECAENGRLALGSAIVELKGDSGRITVAAQHLKPEYTYLVCLIAAEKEKARCLKIAGLHIGFGRKGESRAVVNADSVCETGLSTEEFNMIAVICADCAPGGEAIVALDGVLDETSAPGGDSTWRENLVFFDKNGTHYKKEPLPAAENNVPPVGNNVLPAENQTETARPAAFHSVFYKPWQQRPQTGVPPKKKPAEQKPPEAPAAQTPPEPNATENDFFSFFFNDETEPGPFTSQEKPGATDYHAAFKAMAKKFNEELDELNACALSSAETDEQPARHQPELFAAQFSAPENGTEIDRLMRDNEKTHPFNGGDGEINWVTVSLQELPALPFYAVHYMNHPFLLSAYYRYGHFLLGKNNAAESRYVFGVPAVYTYADRQIAASLKFDRFLPGGKEPPAESVFGYWLMTMA